jgi:hypothetical protein
MTAEHLSQHYGRKTSAICRCTLSTFFLSTVTEYRISIPTRPEHCNRETRNMATPRHLTATCFQWHVASHATSTLAQKKKRVPEYVAGHCAGYWGWKTSSHPVRLATDVSRAQSIPLDAPGDFFPACCVPRACQPCSKIQHVLHISRSSNTRMVTLCNSRSLLEFLRIFRLVQRQVGGGAPIGDLLVMGGSAGRWWRRLMLWRDSRRGRRRRCCGERQKPTGGRLFFCNTTITRLRDRGQSPDR